ncbi:hypothetical protein [Nocardia acidivorans]|uniref:hypothetical protein n=1 Tax=Nocardia acidivorans TaxID=404580 RepID=UPI0012F96D05|nr:hypothetical protein [Nocardia acidivorans]
MGRNSAVCFLFAATMAVAGCDSVSGLDTDAPEPAGTTTVTPTTTARPTIAPAVPAPPVVTTTVPVTTTPRTSVTTTATPLTSCTGRDTTDPLEDCGIESTESTTVTPTKPRTTTSANAE